MSNGLIKHVFPGSNTPQGFHSFFPYILPHEEASHLYAIKGGPGTGKSSFMKRIGAYAVSKGFDVEYHHCSSDPASLDGVVIPRLKVAFVDGTSPHIVDPVYPGAIDSILHFGAFWDETALKTHRNDIVTTTSQISSLFTRTYHYLAAAKSVYDSYIFSESQHINRTAQTALENTIFEALFKDYPYVDKAGTCRHLFGTSISCDGIIDYLHTIIADTRNIFFIKETWGCNTKALMERIKTHALRLGFSIECYHSPIDPSKIEDIVIPALDTVVTVSNPLHKPKVFPTNIYDLTAALDVTSLRSIDTELDRDKKLFMDLIDRAVQCLAQEKKLHDTLESYYIGALDFSRIDSLYYELIDELFPE